jgi:hypothetical protein
VSDDTPLPDPKDHIAAYESARNRAGASAPGGPVLSPKPR